MKDFLGFRFAFNGLVQFLRTERNGRIQGIIALLVIAAGFIFNISKLEWLTIILCNSMVLGMEMINSAIEKVCNLVSTEYNLQIKTIKDISAAAVLVVSIGSSIIGLIIFLPYLLNMINQ